MVKTEIT